MLRLAAAFALTLAAAPAALAADPIPTSGPKPSTAAFVGHVAKPHPIKGLIAPWGNPFMAPNPFSGVHNDPWQSDAYLQLAGPVGRSPQTLSNAIGRDCISLTFDGKGRLEATCTNLMGPVLYLMDASTLDTLATYTLPYVPPAGNPATNTTGGAYFFLDNRGRAVIATADRKITVVRTDDSSGTPTFVQDAVYDPTPCLDSQDRMPSALPDAHGRIWFVGRTVGSVGVLDTKTGKCGGIVLNEEIENSFAVASDGVYIATDKAQYKFTAGADLKVKTAWRTKDYANTGQTKPGQFNAGTGTTPTLIRGFTKADRSRRAPAYVAITDNGDPMDVNVYRTKDGSLVCSVPVFKKGASDTENSLISMGRSLYAENNYGYDLAKFNDQIPGPGGVAVPLGGDRAAVSEPGFARVDIARNGRSCHKAWENDTVRAPSVVPKGDAKTGLIYTFENVKDPTTPDADPWYWTALDARSGKVVFKVLAGYGGEYNNHYAGIAINRDPATKRPMLYVGGVGGMMAMRDT
jgi:hypothetical protein